MALAGLDALGAARYTAETLAHLRELAGRRPLTLLTASKRADISEAAVLAGLLRG